MDQLPAWNNENEYKAIHSLDFDQDLEKALGFITKIEDLNAALASSVGLEGIKILQDISTAKESALILLANLSTFVGCERSLDLTNEAPQKAKAQIDEAMARFFIAGKVSSVYLKQCDEETLQHYLQANHTQHESFYWQHERKMKAHSLSLDEEKTLAQFQRFGRDNWGDLYSSIAGSLRVTLASNKGQVGVAQAAGYLRGADAKLRQEAWMGLQEAWKSVEVPCAAILNNLVGYRHEEYAKRSHTKKMHFLDTPLFESRIEMKTLDAMMGAVWDRVAVPRRALAAMAKALGKQKLDPWDIQAASPRTAAGSDIPFSDALAMITDSFSSVDPKMGEFVKMMNQNKWIDARVMPNKAPGAFCTGFLKSNTPRVFQSYMGTMKDVSTLAHELGHAYHSWVMRDLPLAEKDYPMTLAETASIFSETLLSEQLMAKADSAGKFGIAWEDASDAVGLLINIPARFEFERDLYQTRLQGPLSPAELSQLTDQAWKKWYGDQLSQTEAQYWMTKLHFSISQVSFYNYPYTFGYLFGLGIYAQREKLGTGFHQAYVDILRDTGRMTAESLIQKHLGMDIRKPDFWMESLNIVEKKVTLFESLLT